jgi:hypothetical protein
VGSLFVSVSSPVHLHELQPICKAANTNGRSVDVGAHRPAGSAAAAAASAAVHAHALAATSGARETVRRESEDFHGPCAQWQRLTSSVGVQMRVNRTPSRKRSTSSCVALVVLVAASLLGSAGVLAYSCKYDSHCQYPECSGKGNAQCDSQKCYGGYYPKSFGQCEDPPKCQAGQYSIGNGRNGGNDYFCRSCPAGKYTHDTGNGRCFDCRPGKYSDVVGATTCSGTLCAAGTYGSEGSTSSAAAHCKPCPAGKYQEQAGESVCRDCGEGEFSAIQGATTADTWSTCGFGTFSKWGAANCTACNPSAGNLCLPGSQSIEGTASVALIAVGIVAAAFFVGALYVAYSVSRPETCGGCGELMNCTQPYVRKVQWVRKVACLAFTSWFVLVVLAWIAAANWYGLGPLKGLGLRV